MSYWNLVYHYGVERFARDFENAGGAGLITPDLIPDEAGEWIEASDRHGLDRIFLVSPDSSTEQPSEGRGPQRTRLRLRGRPHGRHRRTRHHRRLARSVLVARTRQGRRRRTSAWASACPPPNRAREVGSYADGVIVGSALVHTLLDGSGNKTARRPEGHGSQGCSPPRAEELADGVHNARVRTRCASRGMCRDDGRVVTERQAHTRCVDTHHEHQQVEAP